MECYKIISNLNLCDYRHAKRWMPRIVFVNKSDVEDYRVGEGKVSFRLSKKGVAYKYPDTLNDVLGNFEISELFSYKQYRHNVQVPFVDYRHWSNIIELTRGEFFAALIDNRDNVFIFGFEYGLYPEDGLVEHINYSTITLRSDDAGLESSSPLLFSSNNPEDDFYTNFENSEVIDIFDSQPYSLRSPDGTIFDINFDPSNRAVTESPGNITPVDFIPFKGYANETYLLRVENDGRLTTQESSTDSEKIYIKSNNEIYRISTDPIGRLTSQRL